MSCWTRIHAHIDVDFGGCPDDYIRQFFSDMKDENYTLCYDLKAKGRGYEITGSELNAVVVAEPLRNYSTDYRNRFYYGSNWSITVSGSLRDREFKETVSEWHRFAWKLAWFVHHDAKRLGHLTNDRSVTLSFPAINYYNVDIVGQGERYHRCSIRDCNENDLW